MKVDGGLLIKRIVVFQTLLAVWYGQQIKDGALVIRIFSGLYKEESILKPETRAALEVTMQNHR